MKRVVLASAILTVSPALLTATVSPHSPAHRPESSPITHVKRARTPTLLLQGENDATDPIGQSQQLYRGLKRYGVASELVLYPREGHGLREEKHLVDRQNRVVAWFDKHLKAAAPTDDKQGWL